MRSVPNGITPSGHVGAKPELKHLFRGVTLGDARTEAVLAARELMSARVLAGRKPNHSRLKSQTLSDNVVLVVWFEETISGN
jgi:hypothetical protein